MKTRRNRYILECKAKICLSTKCPAAGRNRYILECKVFYLGGEGKRYIVEIDTFWNVKE